MAPILSQAPKPIKEESRPPLFEIKHKGKQSKNWIIDNYWKLVLAVGEIMPKRALAMDSDEMLKALNDYEWENPVMAGDMMMQALGFAFLLFLGKIVGDVLETEENFNEIIDILNESMVITGTDDENPGLNYRDIDGNLEQNMNINKLNMGFNVKQSGLKQDFHWKKDE